MTWTGYPTVLMCPPSRMCWGPESKLLALWKHTSLSRTCTSSEHSHHSLSSHFTAFTWWLVVFSNSPAADLWITAHSSHLFPDSNLVWFSSHWRLDKQLTNQSLAGATNNGDVILRYKVIYLLLYNTTFQNENVFNFIKENAQTK